jgi:hypothetical protein
MARLTIDLGTTGNSATGDSVRGAFNKCNLNFTELYTSVANAGLGGLLTTPFTNGDLRIQPNGTGSIEIDQLKIDSSAITSIGTNSDITITANGTGNIVLGQMTIADNKITTNTSNSNLQIDANGTGAVEILTQKVIMANLPTSAAGLATGQLYNDSGTLKVA